MKKALTVFIIIALVSLEQSCSSSKTDNQFESVLNSPDKFVEQEIEIMGIIHLKPEDNAIYLKADSDKSKALWVVYSDMFKLLNTFDRLDGQKVKLRGTFDKTDKGQSGLFAGSLKNAVIID